MIISYKTRNPVSDITKDYKEQGVLYKDVQDFLGTRHLNFKTGSTSHQVPSCVLEGGGRGGCATKKMRFP